MYVEQCRRTRTACDRDWAPQLDLRGLRRRRQARSHHLLADRHRQAQRCRSAGLARRCAGALAGSSCQAHPRTAALELATKPSQTGGMTTSSTDTIAVLRIEIEDIEP